MALLDRGVIAGPISAAVVDCRWLYDRAGAIFSKTYKLRAGHGIFTGISYPGIYRYVGHFGPKTLLVSHRAGSVAFCYGNIYDYIHISPPGNATVM
ncbi:hypothetical protein [Kamptonema formosum]|uniref:hypothetical protein n=1 Tax=Kamptonema formosum TaxID=331992 RepID=UPI00034DBA58|nr:hypothetical protein [Oscillatoria sp. PCC 10802]